MVSQLLEQLRMALRPRPRSLQSHRVHTRCTLQYEATECGAASLSTILAYFGRCIPLSELREMCGVDRDGSSAKRVLQAARNLGLQARAYRCPGSGLRSQGRFPCIIFWGFAHFLVVEGFQGEHVYLSDPAQGRLRVSEDEFLDQYTGVVMEFSPTADFQRGGSFESPLWQLPTYLEPFKIQLLQTLLISSIAVVPTILLAGLASQFIDSVLGNQRLYFAIPILWISTAAIVCTLCLGAGQAVLTRRIQFVLSKGLASKLFEKLFSTPYDYYQRRMQGELAARMQLGLQTSEVLIAQLLSFLISIWQALLIMGFTLFISRSLTILVLAVIALNLSISALLTRLRSDQNRLLGLEIGKTIGVGLQGINNVETLKASGLELDFLATWQEHFSKVMRLNQLLGQQIAISTLVASGSSFLLSVLIIALGGLLIMDGQLTLGTLVAFQFLQAQIMVPLGLIPQLSNVIQMLAGTLGRLEDLSSADADPYVRSLNGLNDPATSALPSGSADPAPCLSGALRLNRVSYGFNAVDPPFLQDLNLSLLPGQHLAIVGASGSGKSTLLKLLAGLYKPSSGAILYDEKGWLEYEDSTIRGSVAYVPQDVFVWNGTVWDNITLWQPGFSHEAVTAAAAMADLHDTITQHPDAYRRQLRDNGADLSGGQRQRLELSRAFLRKPSLLLLDEATSALDHLSEARVLAQIRSAGITTVSVAHRLAAALQSDLVLVLEKGRELERGSPSELLQQDSAFRRLSQAEASLKELEAVSKA